MDRIPQDQEVPVASGADPAETGSFSSRIRFLIRTYGGDSQIARMCGFSEGVIRSWRDGRSDPSRERCLALARGLGISLVWLIAGDGAMRNDMRTEPGASPGETTAAFDTRRLSRAMRVLQSTLESTGNQLSVENRADLLGEYYAALGNPDPVARAEGITEIHKHLVDRIKQKTTPSA
jgi:transcriptional regulator with XRE-family HTH domain